jgi:hypothetical protein
VYPCFVTGLFRRSIKNVQAPKLEVVRPLTLGTQGGAEGETAAALAPVSVQPASIPPPPPKPAFVDLFIHSEKDCDVSCVLKELEKMSVEKLPTVTLREPSLGTLEPSVVGIIKI